MENNGNDGDACRESGQYWWRDHWFVISAAIRQVLVQKMRIARTRHGVSCFALAKLLGISLKLVALGHGDNNDGDMAFLTWGSALGPSRYRLERFRVEF